MRILLSLVVLALGSAGAQETPTQRAAATEVLARLEALQTRIDALNAKIVALNALIAKIMKKLGVR